MAVAAPRAKKNDSATETARVMRVFDMLIEELGTRYPAQPIVVVYDERTATFAHNAIPAFLEVADRIAARTEDPG